MPKQKSDGNCYLCGTSAGKTVMKNHILKEHANNGNEECLLLKIEGAYAREYWLFLDIAMDKDLSALDTFLRKIWLECCGHLSKFSVGKSRKIGSLAVGNQILHEYDYGTTTESLITVIAETRRSKQREAVRLLARNAPIVFPCAACGEPAEFLCQECPYDSNAVFCKICAEKHKQKSGHEMMLPITNSPRSGECGYCGEFDVFAFDPSLCYGRNDKK